MIDFEFTWINFFKLVIGLTALFFVLQFLTSLLKSSIKAYKLKLKINRITSHFFQAYKLLAAFILLVAFLKIDLIIHGVFLLILIALFFPYVRSFAFGLYIKNTDQIKIGDRIVAGKINGEVQFLRTIGVLIRQTHGSSFVDYNKLYQKGFSVSQIEQEAPMRVLYIESELKEEVIDLLFENPLINFSRKPSLITHAGDTVGTLQFTMEPGAKIQDLMSFLAQNEIKTHTIKPS